MTAQFPEGEISAALSSLQRLSDDELQQFLDNEDFFERTVMDLPQVQKWQNEKEMLLASNKSLAEYNLTFEPKLKEGKQSLMNLYQQARSLTDELETKRAQFESLSSRTSLDTTHALLATAAAESEEKSDALTESFLDPHSEIDVDTFLSQFVPLRVTAHLRKLKADKMAEIVNSQRTRPNYSSTSSPYPNNAQMMPQPGPSPYM